MNFLGMIGGFFMNLFTGGTLDKILETINKSFSDEVKKEQIKGEVTSTWIKAQANLLVGRTWWFQLFFVIPLGAWWSAVIFDSIFRIPHWDVAALPPPLDEWAAWIITALFIVDGSKAIMGRLKK
jgi:hypothetical protein